ncbi:hypothetical protein [Paenibacillus ginsengarvi]|uniref:Uncharacterized protein n=1 Tax=Paenibacillus ginsengarvi TaxID=400777 RepID=A0A3B0BRZ3_9BACL|nr:hypothetical protein [Paenibacillus ginsengarvi]RKN74989.1 hypothetical protein D7M11_25970 [Paenibacillus ginsengarvi]
MGKWTPFLILLIPVIILLFTDFDRNFSSEQYDALKDQVELISWIFAGIVSIAGFFGLFISFTFENKLLTASKELKQYYRPYALNTNDLRLFLSNYQQLTAGDKLLKNIFGIFLFVSCSSILVWGTAVGFYTKYKVSFKLDFSIESLLVFGIYLLFFLLGGILIYVTIAINFIRHQRDPLEKGYMPDIKSICDINYLSNKAEVDIDELLFKLSPSLEFYKNPPDDKPKYEAYFHLPIKMDNFRFTMKLISNTEGKEITLRCFGVFNKMDIIGEKVTPILDNNLSERYYNALKNNTVSGEMKLYNLDNKVISRYSLIRSNETSQSYKFILDKVIRYPEKIDIDKGLLLKSLNNQVEYRIECDEIV